MRFFDCPTLKRLAVVTITVKAAGRSRPILWLGFAYLIQIK